MALGQAKLFVALFRGLFRTAFQTGVVAAGELVLELLDASRRVDKLEFARVEGVARVADIDVQFFLRAAGGERVATAALDAGFEILGMNVRFHDPTPRLSKIAIYEGQPCDPKSIDNRLSPPTTGGHRNPSL